MTRLLKLHFKGKRYDEMRGLPLETLSDLAGVTELMRAAARDLFFDGNADRKRVGSGFNEAFQPFLKSVAATGSADCGIEWAAPADNDGTPWFDEAQDEVVSAIECLHAATPSLPDWMSRSTKVCLTKVLRTIDEGESIRWSTVDGYGVEVTYADRLAAEEVATAHVAATKEPFEFVGKLHRIDHDPWGVSLYRWESRRSTSIPIAIEIKDVTQDLWRESINGTGLARVVGEAQRTDEGRTFIAGAEIHAVAGPALSERLRELASIMPGWDADDSPSLPRWLLRGAERWLWGLIERTGVDRPHLFLMSNGGLEAKWQRDGGATIVRFSPERGAKIKALDIGIQSNIVDRSPDASSLHELDDWLRTRIKRAPAAP